MWHYKYMSSHNASINFNLATSFDFQMVIYWPFIWGEGGIRVFLLNLLILDRETSSQLSVIG
jgi:hypothetical protein